MVTHGHDLTLVDGAELGPWRCRRCQATAELRATFADLACHPSVLAPRTINRHHLVLPAVGGPWTCTLCDASAPLLFDFAGVRCAASLPAFPALTAWGLSSWREVVAIGRRGNVLAWLRRTA